MSPVVWIVLGVVVLLLLGAVVSYNRFVRQRNLVQESWRQIDVELTRRHDLVPNLVETVKGYAAHERGTFEAVTAARAAAAAPGSSPAQQAEQENVLTGALRQLFAVAEAYPDLKASSLFQQLQSQLAEIEDRIAAGRRFYNANVRAYNTRIQAFPSNFIASMFHFTAAEYFEANDEETRAVPQVSFGSMATGTPYAGPPAAGPTAPAPGPGDGGAGGPTYAAPPPGATTPSAPPPPPEPPATA
ncbi:MAG TPA: LemA family protein [Actinomycetes bacterium]|nr:LemA family protein [Actinomycetes bacterium]